MTQWSCDVCLIVIFSVDFNNAKHLDNMRWSYCWSFDMKALMRQHLPLRLEESLNLIFRLSTCNLFVTKDLLCLLKQSLVIISFHLQAGPGVGLGEVEMWNSVKCRLWFSQLLKLYRFNVERKSLLFFLFLPLDFPSYSRIYCNASVYMCVCVRTNHSKS